MMAGGKKVLITSKSFYIFLHFLYVFKFRLSNDFNRTSSYTSTFLIRLKLDFFSAPINHIFGWYSNKREAIFPLSPCPSLGIYIEIEMSMQVFLIYLMISLDSFKRRLK